jgi:Holliday junction resolvasome RuvABC DNA-binding subunit
MKQIITFSSSKFNDHDDSAIDIKLSHTNPTMYLGPIADLDKHNKMYFEFLEKLGYKNDDIVDTLAMLVHKKGPKTYSKAVKQAVKQVREQEKQIKKKGFYIKKPK